MSQFAAKQFKGQLYTFEHLAPIRLEAKLAPNGLPEIAVTVNVQFGCHCFTEAFDQAIHRDEHRYVHLTELRAFDLARYRCSLQLPKIVRAMLGGMIYRCQESYTYVTDVETATADGMQDYSMFFSLTRNSHSVLPALNMFVKSAYLKGLAATAGSQRWRFRALIGVVSGVYRQKKTRRLRKRRR